MASHALAQGIEYRSNTLSPRSWGAVPDLLLLRLYTCNECDTKESALEPMADPYTTLLQARAGDRTLDDQNLVAQALACPASFVALYQRYLPRMYAYLRLRTACEEDAADLTQQVFMRAFDALPHYRGRSGMFAAWLFRIARNAATDYHRRQRATVTWDLLPEWSQPTTGEDMDIQMLHREALERLRQILRTLDLEQREILALRFAGRLSSAEIATLLGAREGAIKKRLTRLIARLKEQYHDA